MLEAWWSNFVISKGQFFYCRRLLYKLGDFDCAFVSKVVIAQVEYFQLTVDGQEFVQEAQMF